MSDYDTLDTAIDRVLAACTNLALDNPADVLALRGALLGALRPVFHEGQPMIDTNGIRARLEQRRRQMDEYGEMNMSDEYGALADIAALLDALDDQRQPAADADAAPSWYAAFLAEHPDAPLMDAMDAYAAEWRERAEDAESEVMRLLNIQESHVQLLPVADNDLPPSAYIKDVAEQVRQIGQEAVDARKALADERARHKALVEAARAMIERGPHYSHYNTSIERLDALRDALAALEEVDGE